MSGFVVSIIVSFRSVLKQIRLRIVVEKVGGRRSGRLWPKNGPSCRRRRTRHDNPNI